MKKWNICQVTKRLILVRVRASLSRLAAARRRDTAEASDCNVAVPSRSSSERPLIAGVIKSRRVEE